MTQFDINHDAMLVRTPVGARVFDLEAHLAGSGYTLGTFHGPVGTDPAFTIADWLNDPLIPPCNWAGGTLLERIVSITAEGKNGRLVTNMAPRSATGPDINYTVASTGGALCAITELWLRVRPLPKRVESRAWSFGSIEKAVCVLAELTHAKVHFESVALLLSLQAERARMFLNVDTGDALGRARMSFANKLAAKTGREHSIEMSGTQKISHVTADVELYAPYSRPSGFDYFVDGRRGFTGGFLHRYGTEGVSFRMWFDGPSKKTIETAAEERGMTVVSGGGAFLTNGSSPAVEGIFKRLKEGFT